MGLVPAWPGSGNGPRSPAPAPGDDAACACRSSPCAPSSATLAAAAARAADRRCCCFHIADGSPSPPPWRAWPSRYSRYLAMPGAIGGGAACGTGGLGGADLLAVGAWLGGLLPLFFAVGRLPHEDASTVCHSFTPIGLASVLLLGGTAVVQIGAFMGGLPGSVRHQLRPCRAGEARVVRRAAWRSRRQSPCAHRSPRRRIRRTTVACGARLRPRWCSARLSSSPPAFSPSLTPGTHEQPVWPFPWRPSVCAFDDPSCGANRPALIAAVASASPWSRHGAWVAPHSLVRTWASSSPCGIGDPASRSAVRRRLSDQLLHLAHRIRCHSDRHGARCFAANCAAATAPGRKANGPAAKSLPLDQPTSPQAISARTATATSTGSSRTALRLPRAGPPCLASRARCRARRSGT